MQNRDDEAAAELSRALIQFRYLYHYHSKACSERPNPLRPSDIMMLITIRAQQRSDGGSVTATRLSETMGIKTPSVNAVLSSLEKGGFIVRTTDPDDRRFVRISLSEAGVNCLNRCRDIYIARIRELTDYLGAEKSHELAGLMNEVYGYLRQKKQEKTDKAGNEGASRAHTR